MDKILKPKVLHWNPHEEGAASNYRHWKRTFENFVAEIVKDAQTKATAANVAYIPINKLNILTNYVSGDIFEFIEGAELYDDAIEKLNSIYIHKRNELYARYLLSSRKQKPSESLEQYIQALGKLSKDCDFKDVKSSGV